jgi:SAM-dependent methyltransferase
VADGGRLPFPDEYFDCVISSGVLEHIGVEEHGGTTYSVQPKNDRDVERARFVAELLRVTRPSGRLWLDFPNGAFPIDFWHGTDAGGARWHSLSEGFLPTVKEIRSLVRQTSPRARVQSISPSDRLRFQQVSRHPAGRLLSPFMRLFLKSMTWPGFRWLAGSPFNPYLVIQIDV